MNTHEDTTLHGQLRALQQDRPPRTDLWPAIAARLADTPQSPAAPLRAVAARRFAPWAVAASLLLALGVIWQMLPSGHPASGHDNPLIRQQAVAMSLQYENAIARLQQARTHPEMHAAFGELDRSAAQILTAIDRNPDAVFLLEQLRRTYARRLQLTQRAVMT